MASCTKVDFRDINCLCKPTTVSTSAPSFDIIDFLLNGILPFPAIENANQMLIVDSTGHYQLMKVPLCGTTGPLSEGYVSWNYDPLMANEHVFCTPGSLMLFRMDMHAYPTVSSMHMGIGVPSASLTAGQNYAGLYDASGQLLLQSNDATKLLSSTGSVHIPYNGTFTTAPGSYYAALLMNGTATPAFWGLGHSMPQLTTSPMTNPRFAVVPGHYTSLPTQISIPNTTAPLPIWMALG